MKTDTVLDINEDIVAKLNYDLLSALLVDRTTKKSIIWANRNYEDLGQNYAAGSEMRAGLISGTNSNVIRPRVLKAQEQRTGRMRERA